MQTTELGPFTVSRLCLGTMLMGAKTPADESHRMLDRFLEAGGNFIDTADSYQYGQSEQIVGDLTAADRDHFVVASGEADLCCRITHVPKDAFTAA